jgi:hypothetical protein
MLPPEFKIAVDCVQLKIFHAKHVVTASSKLAVMSAATKYYKQLHQILPLENVLSQVHPILIFTSPRIILNLLLYLLFGLEFGRVFTWYLIKIMNVFLDAPIIVWLILQPF